jgi:hypothetical protein
MSQKQLSISMRSVSTALSEYGYVETTPTPYQVLGSEGRYPA